MTIKVLWLNSHLPLRDIHPSLLLGYCLQLFTFRSYKSYSTDTIHCFSTVISLNYPSGICYSLNIHAFQGHIVSLTNNSQLGELGAAFHLAAKPSACIPFMTLQGAHAPASIALQVMKANNPSHHIQVVVRGQYSPTVITLWWVSTEF